ncbi:MAG: aldo/keto reductase, partial [Lachnospiraceae bacterium]|nr:aldo/keto reductase [Lachnospiraceae bacterium]
MSEKDISSMVEEAISKVGELGSKAGDKIKEIRENETVAALAGSVKKGAKTAAQGVATGAKIAAGGIADGTREVSDTIKTTHEERKGEKKQRKTVRLNNGVMIPMVGFGSYLATENGIQVITDALEAGYRYIDTARFYKNEGEIGEAIEQSSVKREEIFLCSKIWPDMFGTDKARTSFEASCESLRTDYLDMYLLHWPKYTPNDEEWVDKMRQTWAVLEEYYKAGRIKAIGLSNFLPHHLRPLLETAVIRPVVDQLELHVGYMQEYTLAYLKKENIMPQAWSPLGRARVMGDERITKLAHKYGKSNAQILLKFLVQRGIPVIPKASSIERMKENRDIFDFYLTEDEISYLSCFTEAGWSG